MQREILLFVAARRQNASKRKLAATSLRMNN
jgi:hypothetical protein